MTTRHDLYNETLKMVEKLEKEGQVFLLRPIQPLEVGRTTKNTDKLVNLFNQGYFLAKNKYAEFVNWLKLKVVLGEKFKPKCFSFF